MNNLPVKGVYAASITPFGADWSPDMAGLIRHCRWLLDNGCDGIAPLGTTGEANSLDHGFRMAVPQALRDAGIPGDRVVLGTGASALGDAVDFTAAAVRAGYPNVLVIPPFFYKNPSEDGLFAFYSALVQKVAAPDLRLFLYHFPQMSAVPIPHALIERLRSAHGPLIAGLKDSGGDYAYTAELLRRIPGFHVYSGSEQFLLQNLADGGAGCISATANVTAAICAAALNASGAERERRGMRTSAARLALAAFPFPAGLKHLLADHLRDEGLRRVAPPLVGLSSDQQAAISERHAALRFFDAD